jgi:hypothetical protein
MDAQNRRYSQTVLKVPDSPARDFANPTRKITEFAARVEMSVRSASSSRNGEKRYERAAKMTEIAEARPKRRRGRESQN